MHSEANGALMRCAPIGIWARHLPYEKIAEYAREDAKLSHPNQICQDCNAVFCVLIAYLINNPNNHNSAVKYLDNKFEHVHPTVHNWIDESKNSINDYDCKTNCGHVKHAFVLALHFLRNCVEYEEAIFRTLKKGGDTDTTSKICGDILGALHGYEKLPVYMVKPVLYFDCSTHDRKKTLNGYRRPTLYKATNLIEYARILS